MSTSKSILGESRGKTKNTKGWKKCQPAAPRIHFLEANHTHARAFPTCERVRVRHVCAIRGLCTDGSVGLNALFRRRVAGVKAAQSGRQRNIEDATDALARKRRRFCEKQSMHECL